MTQKTVFVFIETTPYKFCIKEKYSTGGLLRLVMYQFCPDVRMSEEFSHVSWLFKRFGPAWWNIMALRIGFCLDR